MTQIKKRIRTILNEFYSLDEFTSKLSVGQHETYDDLDNFLGNKSEKKIGNNTVLRRLDNGNIAVRLWSTDIVVINKLDNKKIYSGGWETRTTADRINQFLPDGVRVFSQKGRWKVKANNGTFDFRGGMIITSNGDALV